MFGKGGFLAELVVERWCVGPRPITSSIWVRFGGGPRHTINLHVTKKCTQSSPSSKVAHSWNLTQTDVGPVDLYLIQPELGPGKVFKPWMSQSTMPIISGSALAGSIMCGLFSRRMVYTTKVKYMCLVWSMVTYLSTGPKLIIGFPGTLTPLPLS